MKSKYYLFSGYRETTGWEGFRGLFKSIDDARLYLDQNIGNPEWAEIVDVDSLTVVWTEFGKD